jgi:hypothetical protein
MDRRAIGAAISVATNTVCQQDDARVAQILARYANGSGTLLLDEFLEYWRSRLDGTQTFYLKDEIQRLCKRAKVEVGAQDERSRLLRMNQEWIPIASGRLARFRLHLTEYPYSYSRDRELRDFRTYDSVDFLCDKWRHGKIVEVDATLLCVCVEVSMSDYRPYSYPRTEEKHAKRGTTWREWVGFESRRIAEPNTNSAEDDESPKASKRGPAGPGPGLTGLRNLGNTCFMNGVLQSLSHTKPLRSYFSTREFEVHISTSPLSFNGRLANGFADILIQLWSNEKAVVSPAKLKALVGEKRQEFLGYQQQDAHEFLAFLLDGLHEDTNLAPYPRPTVETVDHDGKRPDPEVATEAWQRYTSRNISEMVNMFQFQVRSQLECPITGSLSITFDPMMYISLPIPKPFENVAVTVMPYPAWGPDAQASYTADVRGVRPETTYGELDKLLRQSLNLAEETWFAFGEMRFDSVVRKTSEERLGATRAIHAFAQTALPGVASAADAVCWLQILESKYFNFQFDFAKGQNTKISAKDQNTESGIF